jgi:hypothetical protein
VALEIENRSLGATRLTRLPAINAELERFTIRLPKGLMFNTSAALPCRHEADAEHSVVLPYRRSRSRERSGDFCAKHLAGFDCGVVVRYCGWPRRY